MIKKLAILFILALVFSLNSSILFAADENDQATFLRFVPIDEECSPLEVEYPASSSYPHDKDQDTIINKLTTFWEKKLKEETEEDMVTYNTAKVDSLHDWHGYCWGFTMLWLYTKWLQFTHSEKTYGYNNDWFNNAMEDIASWDEKSELSKEKSMNFERFFTIVDFFQNPSYYEKSIGQDSVESVVNLSILDTNGEFLQRTKSSMLSLMDLEGLCSLLRRSVSDNDLIEISGKVGIRSLHSYGLFKHGENYYYYDPNDKFGEYRSKSIENIAEHMLKGFREMYKDKHNVNANKIAISVNVYAFGKEYQRAGLIPYSLWKEYRDFPTFLIDDVRIILKIFVKRVNDRLRS